MCSKHVWLTVVVAISPSLAYAGSAPRGISPEKKVIVWGNFPGYHDWAERLPFDGSVVVPWVKEGKLNWFFFGPKFIPPESYQRLFDMYQNVTLKKFTASLLCGSVVPGKCDWFDDDAWSQIFAKARVLAELCRVGGFIGFVFDTEQYVGKPFTYHLQPQSAKHTYAEYAQQAYERGRQLMIAIAQVKPDIVVLMTYGPSYPATQLSRGLKIEQASYGLLPPFVDGMLERAGQATVVDGYEQSYGYRRHEDFAKGRRLIKEEAASLSRDPKLYRERLQAGFALWLNYGARFDERDFEKNYFTPDELEHALHFALRETDRFVWIYTGEFNWRKMKLSPDYAEAIRNARGPHDLNWRPREPAKQKRQKRPEDFPKAASRADHADEVVFRRLWGKYEELMDLPKQWKFKPDPSDAGQKERWFASDHRDDDWKPIKIGEWWEPQGHVYDGYAWYRLELEIPATAANRKVLLAFGAVDEQAWIYVNGKLAGQHTLGPPGWTVPFEIDVTQHLQPGRMNVIAVRAHDTLGVGGIWKSVKLIGPREK